MKIFTLIENTNLKNSVLDSEHGISFYVETREKIFIFDCGQSGLAWKNAKKLNIDLKKINFVVLSHSHYDHAGGFPALLKYVKPQKIYTGENFWTEKYSKTDDGYIYRGAGFSADDLKNWGVEQKICRDILQIDENIFLIGNFHRRYNFEIIPKKFVVGENKIPDNFDDEICLAIKIGGEIILIVGCSHAGILNIVSTVQERLNLPIKILIGGVHLLNADEKRVDKTLDELKNFGIKNFAFCHCSGEKICQKLNSEILTTGSILEL